MRQATINPAELVTLASAGSAVLGLCALGLGLAPATATAIAVACVGLSLLLDRVDGALARRLGVTSERGARLDTLADLLAFGTLPMVLLVREVGAAGLPVALAYALAAVWRLARYDDDELEPTRFGPAFLGVPTPAAAASVVVALVLAPALAVPVALAMALLMPSRVRYPKRGIGAWPWMVLVPLAIVVAVARAAGGS